MAGKRLTSMALQRSIARIRLAEVAGELFPGTPLSWLNLPEPTRADYLHKSRAETDKSGYPYLEFESDGGKTRITRGLDTRFSIYTDDLEDPAFKKLAGQAGRYPLHHIIADFNPLEESKEDAETRIMEEVLRPRVRRALEERASVVRNADGFGIGEKRAFPESMAFERTVRYQAGESMEKIAKRDGVTRQTVSEQVMSVLALAGIPHNPHRAGRPRAKRYRVVKVTTKYAGRT